MGKVIAIVIAVAKLHNFCIGKSNIPKCVPQTFYRDRFQMMNAEGDYITLQNSDPQLNTAMLTELMHVGEHFNDLPLVVIVVALATNHQRNSCTPIAGTDTRK